MNIPTEAIEAAARAIAGAQNVPFAGRKQLLLARAALTAAAPFIAAQAKAAAWDEGHIAGWNDADIDATNGGAKKTGNPYRADQLEGEAK